MSITHIFALSLALLFATIVAGTAFTPAAYSCAEGSQTGFTTLTSDQLAAMLRQKDFYFVNVHIPYEGEIKNTDAFIVFDKIAENLDRLPKNKDEKIVLYCRSGRMSEIAAQELARLGYSHVSHLAGGMIDWKRSGYEVLTK